MRVLESQAREQLDPMAGLLRMAVGLRKGSAFEQHAMEADRATLEFLGKVEEDLQPHHTAALAGVLMDALPDQEVGRKAEVIASSFAEPAWKAAVELLANASPQGGWDGGVGFFGKGLARLSRYTGESPLLVVCNHAADTAVKDPLGYRVSLAGVLRAASEATTSLAEMRVLTRATEAFGEGGASAAHQVLQAALGGSDGTASPGPGSNQALTWTR